MARNVAGKTALISGGASGIGRVTALAFARAGAIPIIADVDQNGAEETVRMISEAGGEAHAIVTDVTRSTSVDALFSQIAERWDRLDYACNNAGVMDGVASWLDLNEDAWDRIMAINLTGVWLCMRAEIRQMLTQADGAIVNMSSIFGFVGAPASPALTASKHGVIGLTKSAAAAYASAGIRINAVCPAFIETPMLDLYLSQHPDHKAPLVARHPIGRLGTAGEVAEAVLWLCSGAPAFVTGQALGVDGGYAAV